MVELPARKLHYRTRVLRVPAGKRWHSLEEFNEGPISKGGVGHGSQMREGEACWGSRLPRGTRVGSVSQNLERATASGVGQR